MDETEGGGDLAGVGGGGEEVIVEEAAVTALTAPTPGIEDGERSVAQGARGEAKAAGRGVAGVEAVGVKTFPETHGVFLVKAL